MAVVSLYFSLSACRYGLSIARSEGQIIGIKEAKEAFLKAAERNKDKEPWQ